MASGYIAVVLDEKSRATLVRIYPFLYKRPFCHHTTLSYGDASSEELTRQMNFFALTSNEVDIFIEDIYNDENGVECFTVSINGQTLRTDGGKLHLTHSLANGRRPVESNAVVANATYKISTINMTVKGTVVAIEH